MHSIIVDEALSDDFRLMEVEAEVWDDRENFLGAFVAAPGGAPGPEWIDADSNWSRLTVCATVGEKLRAVPGEVKVRDPAGRLLGWFVPVAPAEADHLRQMLRGGE
jgi:hypothetical protein